MVAAAASVYNPFCSACPHSGMAGICGGRTVYPEKRSYLLKVTVSTTIIRRLKGMRRSRPEFKKNQML